MPLIVPAKGHSSFGSTEDCLGYAGAWELVRHQMGSRSREKLRSCAGHQTKLRDWHNFHFLVLR